MTTTVIHNGTLIDGTGSDPIPNAVVVIEGERIIAAGTAADVTIPDGAERIDAGGGTIMPGLIDTHVHMMFDMEVAPDAMNDPFSLRFYRAATYLRRTLDAGITSVRDAGGSDLGVKQAVEKGLIAGPRMQISVAPLGITGGHSDGWLPSGAIAPIAVLFMPYPGMPDGIVDGVEAVRQRVREVLRAGADVIKVMATGGVMSPTDHPEFTQFSPEELAVMVQEGQFRRGVKVMAHAQGVEGIKQAVRAGIHSIEHGIYLDDEAIELMLEHGTYLVPTLLAALSVVEIGRNTGRVPEYAIRKAEEVLDAHKESIAKAHAAGVKIAMGTDAGVMAHGSNLREMGLMCDIGMTAMESIVATTKTAAECMGWDDRLGTVEAGKLADVVVAGVDPLQDINGLADNDCIKVVMQGGSIVKDIR